ncbi:carboxypeptidase-like regulatory domain-containing protein [Alistipes finegoldii]
MPLVGATVIVITGTQPGGGTTTDANGKFAIAAAPGQRLSVSYIGYKETSVEVTTKTDYDIRLESDNAQIDEVIVVGYGTQKKGERDGFGGHHRLEGVRQTPDRLDLGRPAGHGSGRHRHHAVGRTGR